MKQSWKITIFPLKEKNNIPELDWLLKIDLAIFTPIILPFSHNAKFYHFAIMSKDDKEKAKFI